jgi:hypothetical protein
MFEQQRHRLTLKIFLTSSLCMLILSSCDSAPQTKPATDPATIEQTEKKAPSVETTAKKPPTPPVIETFETEPQLSLFPRAGSTRPDETDERFPYWKTFIEHVVKTSGPVNIDLETSNRSWSLRGINSIDSVGFFSPLAVQPDTPYRMSLQIKTDLTEGASAGIGILEFSKFLWIGAQFTDEEIQQYLTGSQEGVRLTGTHDWVKQSVDFTTGPETKMIHLILFREGEHDRNPVFFDDISITPL